MSSTFVIEVTLGNVLTIVSMLSSFAVGVYLFSKWKVSVCNDLKIFRNHLLESDIITERFIKLEQFIADIQRFILEKHK